MPARAIAILIVILLGMCLVLATRTAISEVMVYPPGLLLKPSAANLSGRKDWKKIQGQISHALKYNPHNPEIIHLLGRAYEKQHVFALSSDENARNDRMKALNLYKQAASLRPSWPHDRVDSLLVDYSLHGIKEDTYDQMRTAVTLGPWESWVQQVIGEIGLQQWDSLPEDINQLVTVNVKRAVVHPDDSRRMLYLLRLHGKLELVCDVPRTERVLEYCNRYY